MSGPIFTLEVLAVALCYLIPIAIIFILIHTSKIIISRHKGFVRYKTCLIILIPMCFTSIYLLYNDWRSTSMADTNLGGIFVILWFFSEYLYIKENLSNYIICSVCGHRTLINYGNANTKLCAKCA